MWYSDICCQQWYTFIIPKSSRKRANVKLNFQDDTITIFIENIPLITTESGNYPVPIIWANQLTNNLHSETNMPITLTLLNSKDNHTIRLKLYSQFSCPRKEKLLQLIKKVGKPWCNNQNLIEEIMVMKFRKLRKFMVHQCKKLLL